MVAYELDEPTECGAIVASAFDASTAPFAP